VDSLTFFINKDRVKRGFLADPFIYRQTGMKNLGLIQRSSNNIAYHGDYSARKLISCSAFLSNDMLYLKNIDVGIPQSLSIV
jgi:hypothetical protein